MNKIYLFHYHFIKGGVTTVVRNIINHLKSDYEIYIFTSKEMGVGGIEDSLNDSINIIDFPEISYVYPEDMNKKRFNVLKKKIKKKLKQSLDKDAVYWVHNYQLGKNPSFTDAFLEFIQEENVKTILQIHDFAECARWTNLQFVRKYIDKPLYPVEDNIHYVVINKDDEKRLLKAGIPETNLFYLPNSINNNKGNQKIDKQKAKEFIVNKVNDLGYNFEKEEKIFLNPTRTIRRKNILESILLNKIYNKRSRLIVTLPANSKRERKYEKLVSDIFKNKHVKGIWAISKKIPNIFVYLLEGADLFVSSSVLEGFGLLYLESKINRQNFFTRKLNVLEDFGYIDGDSYYDSIKIEIDKKTGLKIKNKYQLFINKLFLKSKYKDILRDELENIFAKKFIDYSYLDVETQKNIILERNIKTIRKNNFEIIEKIDSLINNYKKQGIETEKFKYSVFTKRIDTILKKVKNDKKINIKPRNVDEKILKSFLKLKNIRLLLNY